MGDEADADWDAGLIEAGQELAAAARQHSVVRRPHTKRDRIRRLRNRVAAINDSAVRSAMAGILDLLEDEL